MDTPAKLTPEQIKTEEDNVRQSAEVATEFWRATMYLYLNASGITLDKARLIRLKTGAVN